MFYVGKRPVTLRLVLGLMEEADNSLETYRWATPALMHSIHTKDTTISDYVNETMMRLKAKMALEELMALKDAKGLPLFCQKNHWWAVFRIFVDLEVGNIRENRYKEFIELIEKLQLEHVNAELDMTSLSNITQDVYCHPFTKWELYIPENASSRWLTGFQRMSLLAEKLKISMRLKGF